MSEGTKGASTSAGELESRLEAIVERLRTGAFPNEASISQGVVLPILRSLGWPTDDTLTVAPEYTVEGRRVDYALLGPDRRPLAFIEVKALGKAATEGEKQLFEYSASHGVPIAVLTDGQEWSFYYPLAQGTIVERKLYKLDLLDREIATSAKKLARYLGYEAAISGDAVKHAEEDHRSTSRAREIEEKLPEAWRRVLEEEERLLELLAEHVEDLSGHEPSPDVLRAFLERVTRTGPPTRVVGTTTTPQKGSSRLVRATGGGTGYGFRLDGAYHRCRNQIELVKEVFAALESRSPGFFERFAAAPHGKKRRYLARNRFDLYPNRPDLAESAAAELPGGWWLMTNCSKGMKLTMIELAARVAGLELGRDLVIDMP